MLGRQPSAGDAELLQAPSPQLLFSSSSLLPLAAAAVASPLSFPQQSRQQQPSHQQQQHPPSAASSALFQHKASQQLPSSSSSSSPHFVVLPHRPSPAVVQRPQQADGSLMQQQQYGTAAFSSYRQQPQSLPAAAFSSPAYRQQQLTHALHFPPSISSSSSAFPSPPFAASHPQLSMAHAHQLLSSGSPSVAPSASALPASDSLSAIIRQQQAQLAALTSSLRESQRSEQQHPHQQRCHSQHQQHAASVALPSSSSSFSFSPPLSGDSAALEHWSPVTQHQHSNGFLTPPAAGPPASSASRHRNHLLDSAASSLSPHDYNTAFPSLSLPPSAVPACPASALSDSPAVRARPKRARDVVELNGAVEMNGQHWGPTAATAVAAGPGGAAAEGQHLHQHQHRLQHSKLRLPDGVAGPALAQLLPTRGAQAFPVAPLAPPAGFPSAQHRVMAASSSPPAPYPSSSFPSPYAAASSAVQSSAAAPAKRRKQHRVSPSPQARPRTALQPPAAVAFAPYAPATSAVSRQSLPPAVAATPLLPVVPLGPPVDPRLVAAASAAPPPVVPLVPRPVSPPFLLFPDAPLEKERPVSKRLKRRPTRQQLPRYVCMDELQAEQASPWCPPSPPSPQPSASPARSSSVSPSSASSSSSLSSLSPPPLSRLEAGFIALCRIAFSLPVGALQRWQDLLLLRPLADSETAAALQA